MKRDKIRLYILEILLIVVLSLALFIWKNISRTILSIILTAYSVLVYFFIKNKKQISFYKNQVAILMTAFGVIYLIVFYLLGIYFGFYKAPTTFGWFSIKNFIFPLTLIIFTSEFIGYSKPSYEYFDTCFHLLDKENIKVDPSECVMIGDSLTSDIFGAKQYGIPTIFFDKHDIYSEIPDSNCDLMVKKLKEIRVIIGGL